MKPINHRGIRAVCVAGCACLALSLAAQPQVVQPMGTFNPPYRQGMPGPNAQGLHPSPASATSEGQPAPQSFPTAFASTTAPSLLDKPAQPAKVDLASGHLVIQADNSSLADILHQLTTDGGMTVDGLGKDERVFGSYGPGDPQEVILDLLHGSGYNVVMLGRTEAGTPKQLTLSQRVAGPVGGGPMRPQPMQQQEDDTEEEPQQPQLIAPPAETTPQPPNIPPNGGVRTPQQMLQELQQMRQLQQQQQQQNNRPQ